MEAQGATEAEKATYDPNAKNGHVLEPLEIPQLEQLSQTEKKH